MSMAKKAKRVVVQGLVHGVSFRASMSEEALLLGVAGWVRNKVDGSVEAHVEGEEADLMKLLEWAKRGPPRARVDSVRFKATEMKHMKGFVTRG